MNQSKDKNFGFSKMAIYQITVEGMLSQDWSERLRGMQIELKPRKDKKPISVLTGKIADQAALAGILKSLYEFRLPVIYVRKLNDC